MKKPASRLTIGSGELQKNQVASIVGDAGEWKPVVLKNKMRCLKFERREFQAPVAWRVYEKRLGNGEVVKIETNVRLLHRIWRKPLGKEGPGCEEAPTEIKPWVHVDRDGRADLRVDLAGVCRNVLWHDAVWYYFHNKGTFKSFDELKRFLKNKCGCRVDHVGGNNLVVNIFQLRLHQSNASAVQGGKQRKRYRESGARVLTSRRLRAKS